MKKCECEKIYNDSFPVWNKLSSTEKELLCNSTAAKNYKKGEYVHGGNGNCTGAVFVVSGELRVFLLSEDGREVTMYRLFPGDVCMLSASCVIQSITFEVFVDAVKESNIYIINGGSFKKVADNNIYVKNFALETAVKRFSDCMWSMQNILFYSLDRRLANFLNQEILKGKSTTIKLTHDEIASNIGSAREAVSRMLKYFQEEGILEHKRGSIKILDLKKLKELIV